MDLSNLKVFFLILYYLFVSVLVFYVILEHRNPAKAFAYIFLIILFPIIGILLYFFFGFHYQKKLLFKRKRDKHNDFLKKINDNRKINKQDHHGLSAKVQTLFENIDGASFTERNEVMILKNGEEKFPALKNELNKAEKFIYIDYYIIDDDKISNEIFDILIKKAAEGVRVLILYDDVGSSIKSIKKEELKMAKLEVYAYMPVLFSRFAHKANYRNHRKIVVIDGITGFVGGINISDHYINPNKRNKYWRDTHVMIKGEAVSELQFLFVNDWFYSTGIRIIPDFEVDLSGIKQHVFTAVLGSEFGSNYEGILEAYLGIIAMAQEEIIITTPYFLPPDALFQLLKTKAKIGVVVKVLLPKNTDIKTAFYASQNYIVGLLESGAEVYSYTKGMIHAKTMVVDKIYSTIGTSNLDQRSFSLNSEVNAFFIDEKMALDLIDHFQEDLRDAYLIDLNSLKSRPWYKKAISSLARLFAPIL